MTLPRSLLLLGLSAAAISALHYEERALQPISPLWDPNENRGTYVHYPEEMRPILNESAYTLRRSPEIFIFTTVPEPTQRIWPLVKGMTLRNHLDNKILWARPFYLIADGLAYGCREMVDGQEEHTPVESSICDDHCIHQGRYCAIFPPDELPAVLPAGFKGKELVKESLRRICFDKYYHASDTKYFEYLEAFDRAQCLLSGDVTECSLKVIEGVDHADYSNLADCVGAGNWEQDIAHDRLEDNLKEGKKLGATVDTLPQLHLGGMLFEGEYTTAAIFNDYCSKSFLDKPERPISCDVCGKCQNVRHCLWTLECDGAPLDAENFVSAYLDAKNPSQVGESAADQGPEPTDPPAPEAAPVATLPPGGIAAGQTTGNADNNNKETSYEKKEEKSAKTGVIMLIIIICVVGVIVAFITYRDRRTKFLMKEIHAEQAASTYRDDGGYVDYVDRDFNLRNTSGDDLELSPSRSSSQSQQPPKMAFLPEMA